MLSGNRFSMDDILVGTRLPEDPRNGSKTPELLIGVLWESETTIRDKIPPSLSGLQYGVQHFPEAPLKDEPKELQTTAEVTKAEKQYDLRTIMRSKAIPIAEDAAAYWKIVSRYAAQIRFVTHQYDLSNYTFPGDFKSLTPAFPLQHLGNEPPPPPK